MFYILVFTMFSWCLLRQRRNDKQIKNKVQTKDYDKYVRVNVETQFTTFPTENVIKFFGSY